ncbi:MAG: hypothetical protein GEU95_10405 [Rhizobiales bacterium]|nr:hypothetical protein [Hyphomicrobiales bacterium]
MARPPSDMLAFNVEYEDGRTIVMLVNRHNLRGVYGLARIIARERQEKGELPEGKIKSVTPSRHPHG